MKKTFLVIAAAMLLVGGAGLVAEESVIIDFTQLDADCVSDEYGNPTQNSRTVMDFAMAAGATFTEEQKELMKTSLALPEWEVELNSSARNVQSVGLSTVVAAPVRGEADVPFAGSNVMGVRVVFPTWNSNANARIVPPFDIPAFEPLAEADADGNRQEQTDEEKASGKTLFEDGYGVVKNVGAIKSIAVTTLGMNYPEGLYVLLKDNDNIERRYFMGYLGFDGWKELQWNNPQYIGDIRNREIRVYPVYPRGVPYVKFAGFLVTRDAAHIGGDYIGYFKDVKIIYDKAVLTSERDIADEDLWGIVTERERRRQALEMARFGNKQVNRYIERVLQATETEFTPSLNEGGRSNAARTGGNAATAADAK
ncbi:MAG: flagellar filament outer layer protein FlaA [Treponema sp.]|nr:flagellar filament outer layer protein FlaA [Treponema sp.]